MLAFTTEVYFSLVAQYNGAIWPAQIPAALLGLLAVLLALRPSPGAGRIVAAILAAAWLWTGVVFHWTYFAGINFAAPALAALFGLQGLLFVVVGLLLGRLRFAGRRDLRTRAGLACVLLAVALHPLLGLLLGRDWTELRHFLLMPAPLTLFTLGLLLLAERARLLMAVPLAWSLIGGAAAWFLPLPEDHLLPVVGLGAVALLLLPAR